MYWAAGLGDLLIASIMGWVKRALMEMSTVVRSMRGQCAPEDKVGCFRIEPEVELMARALCKFRIVGLRIEAPAHDDDALGEFGESWIYGDGERLFLILVSGPAA